MIAVVQRIATCLMFVGDQYGKAEEAVELYVSLFEDACVLHVERFGAQEDESGIKQARFRLAGREFIAMDSGREHPFTFTPAMSLLTSTATANLSSTPRSPASRTGGGS